MQNQEKLPFLKNWASLFIPFTIFFTKSRKEKIIRNVPEMFKFSSKINIWKYLIFSVGISFPVLLFQILHVLHRLKLRTLNLYISARY